MEVMSLRSITVLLNYELMISDPRFKNTRVMKSSFAEPAIVDRIKAQYPQFFTTAKADRTNCHLFELYTEPPSSSEHLHPSISAHVHPDAEPRFQGLSFIHKELIFLETRNHSGCFKAAGLYQLFFKLCHPGQALAIQIKDEDPVLVPLALHRFIEATIHGPKLHTLSSINANGGCSISTGAKDDERHCVISFSHPYKPGEDFVVDMTRMQYGEKARGPLGENYFMGSQRDFAALFEPICESIKLKFVLGVRTDGIEGEERLKNCAARAFQRWQDRAKEGWCEHCGKGGELLRCGACKTKKVWYCCKEHQKAGWKLHKWTCEKSKVAK